MKRALILGAALAAGALAAPGAAWGGPARGPDLSDLDKDERALFDKVAGGELCPCGAATSLASCLPRPDVCPEAVTLAEVAADRIRKGLTYGEVVDAMIRHLERAGKPRDLDLADRASKGPADARIRIAEFSDFQCPHCSQVRPALRAILARFPKDVAVVFKHYPLPFHPQAANAAAAAEVARARGKFWELHDLLFDNQANLTEPRIKDLMRSVGVDPDKVTPADWATAKARVVADVADGDKAGINATPTLFLNGIEIPSEDYEAPALEARIREALRALPR